MSPAPLLGASNSLTSSQKSNQKSSQKSDKWIVNISPLFHESWFKLLTAINAEVSFSQLSEEFVLLQSSSELQANELHSTLFPRYCLPVSYLWPVDCRSPQFIERVGAGLKKRFETVEISNIQVFAAERSLVQLGSNLRGRLLQIFEERFSKAAGNPSQAWRNNALKAPINKLQLQVFLSPKRTFAGLISPADSRSFFAGGRRFVALSDDDGNASRAAAKLVDAEEHLALLKHSLSSKHHWLELGAAPGGITLELAKRGLEVTALDRAPLDENVLTHEKVHFEQCDIMQFTTSKKYDALLCDMNGPYQNSSRAVARFATNLKAHALVIYTLKLNSTALNDLETALIHIRSLFEKHSLRIFSIMHLYHNRQEITVFAQKVPV